MAAVYDVPAFENQVVNRVNRYISSYAYYHTEIEKDYVINEYPFMGEFSNAVIATVIAPNTYSGDCGIRPGAETPRSLAEKGVIEYSKAWEASQNLKPVRGSGKS